MTQSKYFGPIKWLGSAILLVLVAGQLFNAVRGDLLSEKAQENVLWQALPFVSIFVAIILGFILLIFMIALRFNGKIPQRTHQPIEYLTIFGILAGVFSLFQPWWQISYEYGFLLLLGSTIWFTLWSHIVPAVKAAEGLNPFTSTHHIMGAIAGVILVAVMTVLIANYTKPEAPYSLTERRWSRTAPEEQALIAEQSEQDYQRQEIPYIIFLSAFPGIFLYLVVREFASAGGGASPVVQPATA